jgi:hypothetical protein
VVCGISFCISTEQTHRQFPGVTEMQTFGTQQSFSFYRRDLSIVQNKSWGTVVEASGTVSLKL